MHRIETYQDLKVYKLSFKSGMNVFELSKSFPYDEKYSLTDQIRRSSRSVSGNIAEGFQKRRYRKLFVAKLTDSTGEAAETQVWLEYAKCCGYICNNDYFKIHNDYNHIIAMLVKMIIKPESWTFK
jgi:four helix bundle protein